MIYKLFVVVVVVVVVAVVVVSRSFPEFYENSLIKSQWQTDPTNRHKQVC